MTAPDQWIELRMVVGEATNPGDAERWAGQVVVLPPNYPIGSGEGSPGVVLGVRGYTRTNPGATPPLEFVMASLVTPATVQRVNEIPGAQQWTDLNARQVYYNIGLAMIDLIEQDRPPTVEEVVQVLTHLFNGGKTEVLAEIAAGRITPPLPASI